MKSKRSRACDVLPGVRAKVLERDNGRCILCGTNYNLTIAHYISRANGGLGIEENLVCLCLCCHHDTDQSIKRSFNILAIKGYLKSIYENWDENKLKYRKEIN